ncbi:coiled-coil domain-containing protein [Phytohabitans kaempferiae]|uniref:Coiled-coil domain-containing protein n=1 Tax=Phytohabitans kaempferiae TaxID=1620943 RepID=A0ABV6LVV7_9ACTN
MACVVVGPAAAAPNTDDEGASKTLRAQLEAAAKGHIEAKNKLDSSKKRQLELGLQLRKVEEDLTAVTGEVAVLAAQSYRVGRLTPVTMLLNSSSRDDFLERAATLDLLAQRDGRAMRRLTDAREEHRRTKAAIDNEIREQEKQVAILAKRKQDAERALGIGTAGGFVSADSPLARPAPRNPDGSWPKERCIVDDPTTSGCITARTLHAYNQSRAAGFKRHTSCKRSGGGGEHPLGRACDFSAASGGFENRDATGGDRTYGNNLAAFLVKNASRLGVLYVIWYRQIWLPNTGWRPYSGSGSPAATHTNHVHLSMV